MITKLELRPLNGGASFIIFDVQTSPNSDFISAKTYVAQRNYSEGTQFYFKSPRATYTYETREPVLAGGWSYPGDPRHFRRLKEPLLLEQISEVPHAT